MKRNTQITLIVLLLLGAASWAIVAGVMKRSGGLAFQPNALHLKGSPYGRTLALAMRGPADVYWHRGEGGIDHDCGPGCDHGSHGESGHEGCGHDHGDCDHDHGICDHEGCDHGDHAGLAGHEGDEAEEALFNMLDNLAAEHAEHEAEHHHAEEETAQAAEFEGVRPLLLGVIEDMRKAYHSRSNRRGESALHRAFVMGETQRRLALSYEMDPTNIACYGAYFMFLAEAMARVQGGEAEESVIWARQQAAMRLSNYTLRYCLKRADEAPAMVTGAMAAHDYLQIQLASPNPDLEEAAEVLRILDQCIERYELIRGAMAAAGTWENFPEPRRVEMEQAHRMVGALREADREIFKRLSGGSVAAPEAPADEGVATR